MLQSWINSLKQEKWMLQSSIDSWKQRNWNLNTAVIIWLFFEPKIWNWTLQSTIIWNHTACACNCQLVSESGKLNNYTLITNYCLLSADIELALNVSTYAGQRSPLVMTSQWYHQFSLRHALILPISSLTHTTPSRCQLVWRILYPLCICMSYCNCITYKINNQKFV